MVDAAVASRIRSPGPIPYAILSAVALVSYSSWNRPLWYDEMVYFVLGGFDSTADVFQVIDQTTTNVNQGVTGAYMLVSFWSLELFGAHAWALRLPSMLFAVYFFFTAALFLRGRGVGWWGVSALPVLLMGQESLMYYAGEARTYMPLAAATTGILAYYFIPISQRSRWGPRLLGWSAVLIGVLFHPYFALYWPLVLVFALTVTKQWRITIRFTNPVLVAVGTAVFFLVAALTWLRGTAQTETLDPYRWLGDSLFWAIPSKLGQFIYVQRPLIVASAVIIVLAVFLAVRKTGFGSVTAQWWPPLLLIAIAFVSSWILAGISVMQGFWIIQRQWIASVALISIAIIWFWSRALASIRNSSGEKASNTVRIMVAGLLAVSAVSPLIRQTTSLLTWQDQAVESTAQQTADESALERELQRVRDGSRDPLTDDEWVDYSNANVLQGGKVWDSFRHYYLNVDWSDFVIRDSSSSPTRVERLT